MSDDLNLPSEVELAAERAGEDRFERWLLVREVAIILILAGALVTHLVLT
jgi:hypothetical protein